MLRYVIGLVALVTVLSSCSTDLNLTGDYHEKALIYGLLDPKDNPNVGGEGHLFRIQKAFLGEESAFIMALEPDSSYFAYDGLLAELVEYDGTTVTQRWELDTVVITNKDTGNPDDNVIDFFGPDQRLYRTNTDASAGPVVNIDPSKDYAITLKHRPQGSTSTDSITPFADGLTSIVDAGTFRWNNPSENSNSAQKMDLFNTSGQYKDYTLRFKTANRAKQYEVWLRFYYREVVLGIETVKSIEWRVATFELNGETDWQVQLASENLFSRIGSELQPEANTVRKIGKADGSAGDPHPSDGKTQDFDMFIRLAGSELFSYLDINKPSNSGALQDKPVYTNINNGLGVFSSRTSVEFNGLYLSTTSEQQLVDGQYTSDLGFIISPN